MKAHVYKKVGGGAQSACILRTRLGLSGTEDHTPMTAVWSDQNLQSFELIQLIQRVESDSRAKRNNSCCLEVPAFVNYLAFKGFEYCE